MDTTEIGARLPVRLAHHKAIDTGGRHGKLHGHTPCVRGGSSATDSGRGCGEPTIGKTTWAASSVPATAHWAGFGQSCTGPCVSTGERIGSSGSWWPRPWQLALSRADKFRSSRTCQPSKSSSAHSPKMSAGGAFLDAAISGHLRHRHDAAGVGVKLGSWAKDIRPQLVPRHAVLLFDRDCLTRRNRPTTGSQLTYELRGNLQLAGQLRLTTWKFFRDPLYCIHATSLKQCFSTGQALLSSFCLLSAGPSSDA